MLRPSLILGAALALASLSATSGDRPSDQEIRDRAVRAFGVGGIGAPPKVQGDRGAVLGKRLSEDAAAAVRQENPQAANKATRDNILRGLGYSPDAGEGYIFVSESMDQNVIRSYAREAMWAGFTLVVRGIAPNMDFNQYIHSVIGKYVNNKGATASIQIDPRLFDRYSVTRVPTIVWDERPSDEISCNNDTPRSVPDGAGGLQPIHECVKADESSFYKMSGQVTLDYALEKFADAGSKTALDRINVMRNFLVKPSRDQVAFDGDWDSLDTPKQEAEFEDAMKRASRKSEAIERSLGPVFDEDAPVP